MMHCRGRRRPSHVESAKFLAVFVTLHTGAGLGSCEALTRVNQCAHCETAPRDSCDWTLLVKESVKANGAPATLFNVSDSHLYLQRRNRSARPMRFGSQGKSELCVHGAD